MKEYIARHGLPQTIRTDPVTIYRSKCSEEFCEKRYIKHLECPMRDLKGNGEIERLNCRINERLGANKEIIVGKDNFGLSEIPFALRLNPLAKNTIRAIHGPRTELNKKRILTNKQKCISEKPEFPLADDDFESGQYSTILVRERSPGSKLEGTTRQKEVLLEQSNHTITFLHTGGTTKTIISKRNIGHSEQPCSSEWRRKLPLSENETTKTSETTNESELPQSSGLANQTANQNEATMTEPTELAGKTKDTEKSQSAIRYLKQKIRQ